MPVSHRTSRDARSYTPGLVHIHYSATLQGTGAVTLPAGGGVSSLVYASSTGKYTLTLLDSVKEVESVHASLESDTGGDGGYATVGAPANVNSSVGGSPISATVWTFAAGGTKTNFTGRRISIDIWMKDTSVT